MEMSFCFRDDLTLSERLGGASSWGLGDVFVGETSRRRTPYRTGIRDRIRGILHETRYAER